MTKVLKIYTRIVLLLVPFFFLPMVYDSFGLGKSSFVFITGVIGLILWVVSLFTDKQVEIKYNKWLWWILILLAWSVVSFFKMTTGGQARSIASIMGIGGLAGLTIWFFLWLQVRSKEETEKQMLFLSISAIIVAATSLISFLVPTSKLPLNWPKTNPIVSITAGWSIAGSLLSEVVLFLTVLIVWVRKLVKKLKDKVEFGDYFKEAIAVAFFGLMMLLDVYKIIKQGWVYLDGTSGWVIAAETLKNNPIFGVGLGNFAEAFSRFRPASFNTTAYWSSSFGVSSMGLLNWWSELGLVGLVIILGIAFMSWKKRKDGNFWGVGLLGLLVLMLPPTYLNVFLWFLMLGLTSGELKETKLSLPVGEKKMDLVPYISVLIVMVVVGFGGYKTVKVVLGDYYWKKSLLAAAKNDGSGVYNLQIKAIGMNPNLADYRAVYSQTNLALAETILASNEGKDLSTEDKEKASTLVQQAVREGQAAVSLDSNVAAYWSNLGSIYKSLVGVVDSALNWSVQSYQQAAVLDPVNPSINMQLGSISYGAGDYASAERYFEDAVKDKSDYANAWYNWAYAAKQQNNLQNAVTRLDQALKLIPADSDDYKKGKEELDKWNKELEEVVKKYQEQLKQQEAASKQQSSDSQKTSEPLTTPQPLPTEGKEEKVNVPAKDLEPPQATVTPSN
jgi:Tfp pilus assembly protein PilF